GYGEGRSRIWPRSRAFRHRDRGLNRLSMNLKKVAAESVAQAVSLRGKLRGFETASKSRAHRDCLDYFSGCIRTSARAFSRAESAALFVIAALFSKDDARLFSFARSLSFRVELSAL